MLVLTRKVGESLIIGDNVVITVVSQKGGQVRLGIEAPASVSIQREEIVNTPKSTEAMPNLQSVTA
ncbi:carbon storage regulator CsrA [Thiosulfativibrio zosterae]|uniref:Translational regulator CsrA n=1 Tax=Thiosulfativibrio zosterae TaxID=2675053 RepID=A0A6F8PMJ1_9GAMM|nr:carbon storage regulator CsrA [Thiosulfativibrio zosterae]BBP43322.1 carbon storage regulator [Thiosulfativibrio zosterae]